MVGRNYEINRLLNSLKSNASELIAVYGRRRVGKTFLIRNIYKEHIKFEVSGLYQGEKEQQLDVFFDELKKVSLRFLEDDRPKSWKDAFELLKKYINGLRGKEKKVIFIDEMPWLDTHKSDFRMYFGHFWNTYCEKRNDLIIVICGSAASYMVQNVVSNQGSLHARLTYKLHIKPFTLYETKAFLESKNIHWGHYHILHLYIAIGGIPHYLNKIQKGESVVQTIQRLCFDVNGDLVNEFEEIFESLFTHSSSHISMVRALAQTNKGLTREELILQSNLQSGGAFSKALEELIASGFVTKYAALNKKSKSTLYRLSDE
jgi:predicted AAA+ superfamily ATPase